MGKNNNSSIKSYTLELIFGKSEKSLPEIIFFEENFKAIGIVIEKNRLFKNGNSLAVGETFDVGVKHSYLVAVWKFFKIFYAGGGISAFEFTGNRVIDKETFILHKKFSVEEKFSYSGFSILCGFKTDFKNAIWLPNNITFPVNFNIYASEAEIGICFKGGFDVGIQYNFYKDYYIKYWMGTYTWEVSTFDFDSEIADTDYGNTIGLEFSVGI